MFNINDYISYQNMFGDIMKQYIEEGLFEDEDIDDDLKNIKLFYDADFDKCEEGDECDITEENIIFVFVTNENNTNESNRRGSGFIITIELSRQDLLFTSFDIDSY